MAFSTSDPRFRRRLNELGQSVENATEQAQSSIYIFGQNYIKPCFDSVTSCLTTCVDASCPSLNLSQRDRLRRQRGHARSRGRAELSFDFYDDWDDFDENDGLLGWGGNDDFDRLLAGSGAGYGSISQQPGRQRGMSYSKTRRKSAAPAEGDGAVITGPGLFGKLFGGKAIKYRPSAADLQEHPGTRRLRKDMTEGEALLEESEVSDAEGLRKTHRRARSGTAGSAESTGSYSSRGDIFPSDEEDAIPLDDEFAMVLERRNTQSGPETESSSARTRSDRGKRPSAGSRTSTRRTVSSRSTRSSVQKANRSRSGSGAVTTPIEERQPETEELTEPPALSELKQEERQAEREEEAEITRRREEAQRLAEERGLKHDADEQLPSKEGTTEASASAATTTASADEPSQLPTPLPTDDEEDSAHQLPSSQSNGNSAETPSQD
ncbi:hypothetical protein BAUCODRAFT_39236 [Baudoinia panamericana UAMH 10762]|uniref:Uncharacterized protein n=1 Tax=Baudoinia panamericana (strain UAMH 10762) TaxID=717646 RepID=M2MWW0_BAUPA|nr:uncharacterized protein BAUCODRAFT_39236 [Baudoinia panamericana UAMH 10762]EMC91109.1 hypothetical protein BAUCODRAFT_39236 [Baudoinia panamericana UAMH 10762]